MEILAAENKNRQLEDLPQADFGRLPGRFLLSVRTKSITDNFCILKITPTVVFVMIQGVFFFILSLTLTHFLIFIRGSSSSIKSTFLVNKGPLCLYNKQSSTWLPVNMAALTRELSSVEHSVRNSISTRAMNYSLFLYFPVSVNIATVPCKTQ